jgi:4-oxalocrotonate tautomerase
MPLAQISLLEGRSKEMIEQMAEAVTDVIAKSLGTPRETIRVVVTEIPASRWFVAGESMAERERAGGAKLARSSSSELDNAGRRLGQAPDTI